MSVRTAPIATRRTLLVLIAINSMVFLYLVLILPAWIDFRAFYFAGETIRTAPGHIYDLAYQKSAQEAEFKDAGFAPFFHPPHELILFAPLSKLPFRLSLNVWRGFSLLCLIFSGILLARAMKANLLDTVLLVAATSAVPMCLAVGQDSLLVLLLVSGCFYLLKSSRDIPAAAVLALALFKPQLPVVLAVAVLAAGWRRFFVWFAIFGSVLTASSMAYVGRTGVLQILHTQKIGETGGIGIATMVNLRGLIALIFGDHKWISLAVFVVAIGAMGPLWRRSRSLEFAIASSVCLVSAFTFYIYDYDLVALAIPLVLVLTSLKQKEVALLAAMTSAPLHLLAHAAHLFPVLLLLTIILGLVSFRLRAWQQTIDHSPPASRKNERSWLPRSAW